MESVIKKNKKIQVVLFLPVSRNETLRLQGEIVVEFSKHYSPQYSMHLVFCTDDTLPNSFSLHIIFSSSFALKRRDSNKNSINYQETNEKIKYIVLYTIYIYYIHRTNIVLYIASRNANYFISFLEMYIVVAIM